jgi:hypothetical protein
VLGRQEIFSCVVAFPEAEQVGPLAMRKSVGGGEETGSLRLVRAVLYVPSLRVRRFYR